MKRLFKRDTYKSEELGLIIRVDRTNKIVFSRVLPVEGVVLCPYEREEHVLNEIPFHVFQDMKKRLKIEDLLRYGLKPIGLKDGGFF